MKSGRTALHLACNREAALVGRYPVCQFPLPQLVKALLMVGANPNSLDDDGNAPLHLAALARPCPASLAQALVEHGAHLVSLQHHIVELSFILLLIYFRTQRTTMEKHSDHCFKASRFTSSLILSGTHGCLVWPPSY